MSSANQFLRETNYIQKHNDQFAVSPAQEGDAHASIAGYDLDNIFCIKEERILMNDFTISYKKRILQLIRHQKAVIRPKEAIRVHEHLDGSISLHVRGYTLQCSQIAVRQEVRISPVGHVNLERKAEQNVARF